MKRIKDLKSTKKTLFVFRSQRTWTSGTGEPTGDPTTSTMTVITTVTTHDNSQASALKPF